MTMRYAVIQGNTVVNVIEADEGGFALDGYTLVPSEIAGPGWSWDGEAFSPPPPPPPPPPPSVVSMRQARLALLGAGLLGQVETALDALPEPQRSAARIEWEYATELRRDHALVAALAPALELDEAALDNLFAAAAGIP